LDVRRILREVRSGKDQSRKVCNEMSEIGAAFIRLVKKDSAINTEDVMAKVTDILSPDDPVLTHATSFAKRDIILRQGLESGEFAARTGNKKHESRTGNSDSPYIWFDTNPFRVMETDSSNFGIIAKPNGPLLWNVQNTPPVQDLRRGGEVVVRDGVSPKEFTGFVLPYFEQRWRKKLKKLVNSARKAGLALPIYDRFGNLIWPKQISHDEIRKTAANKKRTEVTE